MKILLKNNALSKRNINARYGSKRTSKDSFWFWNIGDMRVHSSIDLIRKVCDLTPAKFEEFQKVGKSVYNVENSRRSHMHPHLLISMMYDGDELTCVRTRDGFEVKQAIDWGEEVQNSTYMLPNPNRVPLGYSKNGKSSPCCRDAVGKRKYLIVELNDPRLYSNMQASIIRYLQTESGGDLELIVRTEGQFPQAWFNAFESENKNWEFMKMASSLGAEPSFWRPEKTARVPNGFCHKSQAVQNCIYFA